MQPEQIRALFLQELEEQTRELSHGVLALEAPDRSRETVDDVFRAAHSLKGAAQVTGATAVADVAHGMESILGAIRSQTLAVDADIVTALLGAVDWLGDAAAALGDGNEPDARRARTMRAHLNGLAEPRDDAQPDLAAPEAPAAADQPPLDTAPAQRTGTARSEESVRVAAAKLDALLRQASEVTVARQRVESVRRDIMLAGRTMTDHATQWRRLRRVLETAAGSATLAPEISTVLERTEVTWRAAAAAVEPLPGRAAAAERDLRQAAVPLTDKVLDLRTMPFAEVCAGFDRVVRDAARHGNKEAVLRVEGGAVELDRSVAMALREPLIHLVHNAVDHGIETLAGRRDAGKPTVGQVTLAAELRGDRIEIVVRDDGAGVHAEAIRAAADRLGLGELDERDDLLDAIFSPGFTTLTEVTATSGRGVGLDAVRARVDGLGGSVGLVSEPGMGTSVRLIAPITLSILHTISVVLADQVVMLSSSGVQRAVHVTQADVRTVAGWPTLLTGDRHVPMVDLAQVLGWPAHDVPAEGPVPTLLVDVAGRQVGLTVSALLGEGETTVHNVGERVGAAPAVVGVSLLPEGGLALILSAVGCARLGLATSPSRALRQASDARSQTLAPRVLLAEDTLTTRVLEQGILEGAGYEVVAAVDGADAWQKLREGGADLVVTDVNMPRMDGFELCAAIRGSRRFADLPVVLVTSLADDDDRRRGVEAGANAYIVKSGFDQGLLLDTVARLLP